jgi:hypothetical protein
MGSSPGYPQSNGQPENAVKNVKRIMKKSLKSGEDPFLALLSWRNTPSEGMNSSPVQRLYDVVLYNLSTSKKFE